MYYMVLQYYKNTVVGLPSIVLPLMLSLMPTAIFSQDKIENYSEKFIPNNPDSAEYNSKLFASINNSVIEFPEGIFYFAGQPLELKHKTKIIGKGKGSTVLIGDYPDSFFIMTEGAGTNVNKAHRFGIIDLTIISNNSSKGAIMIQGWRSEIRNCEIQARFGHGVHLASEFKTNEIKIINCYFNTCKNGIVAPGKEEYADISNDVEVSSCYFNYNKLENDTTRQQNCIYVNNAGGWIFTDNHFWSSSQKEAFVILKEGFHTLITGNYFERNNGKSALKLEFGAPSSFIVSNNSFWLGNNQSAISITGHPSNTTKEKIATLTGNLTLGNNHQSNFLSFNNRLNFSHDLFVSNNATNATNFGEDPRIIGNQRPYQFKVVEDIRLPIEKSDRLVISEIKEGAIISLPEKSRIMRKRNLKIYNKDANHNAVIDVPGKENYVKIAPGSSCEIIVLEGAYKIL